MEANRGLVDPMGTLGDVRVPLGSWGPWGYPGNPGYPWLPWTTCLVQLDRVPLDHLLGSRNHMAPLKYLVPQDRLIRLDQLVYLDHPGVPRACGAPKTDPKEIEKK